MSGDIPVRDGSNLGLRLRARSKWQRPLVILAAIAVLAACMAMITLLDPLFQVPTTTTYVTQTGNATTQNRQANKVAASDREKTRNLDLAIESLVVLVGIGVAGWYVHRQRR